MIVLALIILGWPVCGVLGYKLFHAFERREFGVWALEAKVPQWLILLGPLLLVSVIVAILTYWVENK